MAFASQGDEYVRAFVFVNDSVYMSMSMGSLANCSSGWVLNTLQCCIESSVKCARGLIGISQRLVEFAGRRMALALFESLFGSFNAERQTYLFGCVLIICIAN